MTPASELHPSVARAIGFFEALRRVGFTSDEIFVIEGLDQGGVVSVLVQLRSGGREWTVNCGPADGADPFQVLWWNDPDVPQSEKDVIWDRWLAEGHAVEMLLSLLSKGIQCPFAPATFSPSPC